MSEESTTHISPPQKQDINIRFELVFKCSDSKSSVKKDIVNPLQGSPISVYLKVTNIDKHIFKGGIVKKGSFDNNGSNTRISFDSPIQIPALNPNESTVLFWDKTRFIVDGAYWFQMEISPEDKGQKIRTYQFDKIHAQDEFHEVNKWGDVLFIESKSAYLQTKTNHYILALTFITVWEAIFGIKDSLQWFSLIISKLFFYTSDILLSISSI